MPDSLGADSALVRDTRRFGFFQALRLIESMYSARPRLGYSPHPRDDAVRLGQNPRLGFAAAELDEYRPPEDGRPARLSVNVGGLFGSNGPMPLHLTEYAHNRLAHGADSTLAAFADIFHHRQLCLFYRAWAAGQPVVGLDRDRPGAAGYGLYVASLCGLSPSAPARPEDDDVLDKLQFCGLLSSRTRHASGLGLLLSQYFGVPIKIKQFVGVWLELSREDSTRLEARSGRTLGNGLLMGKRLWDRQSKFRAVVGPVGVSDMLRLLPGTASHRRLVAWVDLYTGGLLEWDMELQVTHEGAACMKFDGRARLAYTSWLGRKTVSDAPSTVRIQPRRGIFPRAKG